MIVPPTASIDFPIWPRTFPARFAPAKQATSTQTRDSRGGPGARRVTFRVGSWISLQPKHRLFSYPAWCSIP